MSTMGMLDSLGEVLKPATPNNSANSDTMLVILKRLTDIETDLANLRSAVNEKKPDNFVTVTETETTTDSVTDDNTIREEDENNA